MQIVSALLQKGPEHLKVVREDLLQRMEENEYESLDQMRGNMKFGCCPDPQMFERAKHMRVLLSWHGFA